MSVRIRLETSDQNPFNLVGFHLNTVAQGQVGEDLLNLVEQMVEARRPNLQEVRKKG